jgi:hypothetical protein
MTRTSRLALVALSGLAACTVNPDNIKPTVADLCREAQVTMGDRYAECDGYAVAWARWMFSMDIDCAAWSAAVAAGRMAYDESAGVQCINDLRSMSCDQLLNSNGPPGACAQAIRGLVPAGSACRTYDECATGTYCDSSSACGGTCKAYANVGAVCYSATLPWANCRSGLNCMDDGTATGTSRCYAPLLAGQNCPQSWGCADGLYCDTSSGVSTSYTCKTDPTSGQSCGNGWSCAAGLFCNYNSAVPAVYKTCQPSMTTGPCGQYNACQYPLYICAGPSYSWSSPGQCQAIAREGQPCQHGYHQCVWGAYCKTAIPPPGTPAIGDPGVCTVYPGPPGFCGSYGSEYVYCLASYCNATGTCASFIPVGGACPAGGGYGECGPGSYCNTGVTPYICAANCP